MSTSPEALDAAVETVAARSTAWARLGVEERIRLAQACIAGLVDGAADMVAAGCRAKGLDVDSSASAEEWLAGPIPSIRNLRLLTRTLSEIASAGRPAVPGSSVARVASGPLAVRVFPCDRFDALLYPGMRIDVWMDPGVDEHTIATDAASAYAGGLDRAQGVVSLVLGAGNVASIGPMDVFHKLFVENHAVVLKLHPVNDYLGPVLERALRPLIAGGFLRIVHGDAAEGHRLVHHAAIDEIHMTGSGAVHDRIVWGDTAEEQRDRRARRDPKVRKRITSELGCVTPIVVVPGDWSVSEIDYHAEYAATMVANNASCNCNAAKLLVTWRRWPGRRAFLERITHYLGRCEPRCAYYPGAERRQAAFVAAYPSARAFGPDAAGTVRFATVFDLSDDAADDRAFREEAWSPILAEISLDDDDDGAFLQHAVEFCNERVFGTLSAMVLANASSRARLGSRFDAAIAALRYGTIGINHWSAVSFALAVAPWGAFPGHTLEEVGSGIGFVHNTRMFDRPLKTVLDAPFVTRPRPVWFLTHRRAHVVGRKMVRFEASPSIGKLPGIAVDAIRG